MPCPDLEQLDRYLNDDLDLAGRSTVGEHLDSCDSCRAMLDELREHESALTEIRSAWSGATGPARDVDAPTLPGYEILRTIHEGGQGIVYEAHQRSTKRPVAIKLLLHGRYATKRQRRRFEREIDLAAQLDHANIVTVFDSGTTDDGRPFLVMRYVDGWPLDEYVAARTLEIGETLLLFARIGEAVNYAHQRGVIHRDLKPSNILIDEEGEPHLLDFGLAKPRDEIDDVQRSIQTQAGEFVGTLAYAAPEQVSGDPHAVDVRSDVYSLGVILFEMLTSAHPYPVDVRLAEIVRNITEVEPVRPSSMRREVDDELDTIVIKTLSKEKDRRYQSVADLLRDLERYRTGQAIEAKGDSTWYVLRKTLRRHRVPAAAAAVMLAVLLTATIISLGFWRQAVADRQEALDARDEVEAALRRVELEADKVVAINEFLVGMLASANPIRQGKDVLVREALDEAAASIDESFAGQPLIEAEVRHTLGNTYAALGLFEAAEPHILRAANLRADLLGESHPDTLSSHRSLALLYSNQGRLDEAAELSETTYQRRIATLGKEHPDTLQSQNDLALVYFRQGRYDETETLWSETLQLRRRLLGDEHVDTLLSMSNLAWLYTQTGKYDLAEPLAVEALAIERRVLGDDHLITLRTGTTLAGLLDRQGRYEEAEPLYAELLEAKRRVLGEEHPETLFVADSLGWLYIQQERFEEAEELFLETLDACRRVLGDEHLGTLQVMNSLAVLYNRQEREEEAESMLVQTLDVRRRVLGPEHPDTLISMNNLAALYYDQDRLEEVETLWSETLDIRRRVLGEEHPETLSSM
ncbi:MAG: serine/threonine protein kinase, partial [Phycisphaerales bacterium]